MDIEQKENITVEMIRQKDGALWLHQEIATTEDPKTGTSFRLIQPLNSGFLALQVREKDSKTHETYTVTFDSLCNAMINKALENK